MMPAQWRFLWVSLAGSVLAFALCASAAARYRIGYDGQETRCLPWSIYLLDLGARGGASRDQLVAYKTRGLLGFPDGTVFVKRVTGIPGDEVAIADGIVQINRAVVDTLRPEVLRRLGRTADGFAVRRVLQPGEFFLMGSLPASYDSRYFGPVRGEQIFARARALW